MPSEATMRLSQPNVSTATAAVREAAAVLERASSDWRNGDARSTGPIHWSAAVPAARDALSRALLALEIAGGAPPAPMPADPTDEIAWCSLTVAQRSYWQAVASREPQP